MSFIDFKSKLKLPLIAFFMTLFSTIIYGQNEPQIVKSEHVHEAFMTMETGVTLLNTVPLQPPAPINENIPVQTDSLALWIPGYWDWSYERQDFVWCTGSWRRPPPGRTWIPGYWHSFKEGWVRLKGFWGENTKKAPKYIQTAPPTQINENPQGKPGNDYFWMSGYWEYDQLKKDYIWLSGQWEKLDPQWVYVPAQYVWRPQGYIFVPAFWDWTLDLRGTAYACVQIPVTQRADVFTPIVIVEPLQIIETCLFYYPDYSYFFCHHYYFHSEWWWDYSFCPPWWVWDWWWCSWENHWALWWWWCNPGFPAPDWLPHDVIIVLPPPPHDLVIIIDAIHPPLIVTPEGVVSIDELLEALDLQNGENSPPIFPIDPSYIQDDAAKTLKPGDTTAPQGSQIPLEDLGKNPQPFPEIPNQRTPPSPTQPGKQPPLPPSTTHKPKVTPPVKPQRPNEPPTQVYPQDQTIYPTSPLFPEKPITPQYPPSKPLDLGPTYVPPIKPLRPMKPPTRPINPDIPTRPIYPINPNTPTIPSKPTFPDRPSVTPPWPLDQPNRKPPEPNKPTNPNNPPFVTPKWPSNNQTYPTQPQGPSTYPSTPSLRPTYPQTQIQTPQYKPQNPGSTYLPNTQTITPNNPQKNLQPQPQNFNQQSKRSTH